MIESAHYSVSSVQRAMATVTSSVGGGGAGRANKSQKWCSKLVFKKDMLIFKEMKLGCLACANLNFLESLVIARVAFFRHRVVR